MTTKQLRFSRGFFSLSRFALAAFLFLGMTRLAMGQSYVSIGQPADNSQVCGSSVDVVAGDDNPHGVSEVDCGVNGGSTSPMNYDDSTGSWYTTVGLSAGNNTILCVDDEGYSDSVTVISDPVVTTTAEIYFKDPEVQSSSQSGPFYSKPLAYDPANWISAKINASLSYDTSIDAGEIDFTFNAPGIPIVDATDSVGLDQLSGTERYLQGYASDFPSSSTPRTAFLLQDGVTWDLYTGYNRNFDYTWEIDPNSCSGTLSIAQGHLWTPLK